VAALRGVLPDAIGPTDGVRGCEMVLAQRACRVAAAQADEWAAQAHCHDLPPAGSQVDAGTPVCTVSAQATDAAGVERLLAERTAAVASRIAAEETDGAHAHIRSLRLGPCEGPFLGGGSAASQRRLGGG
jgi:predicted ATP-grasp superfamily ATP-dependent carboligase